MTAPRGAAKLNEVVDTCTSGVFACKFSVTFSEVETPAVLSWISTAPLYTPGARLSTPTVSSIETSPPVDDPSVGTTAIQPADGTAMKFSTPPPEFRTLKF